MEWSCCLLLLVATALVPMALAEKVKCKETVADCTKDEGYSEMIVREDSVFCCSAGYSLLFDEDSDDCFCNKTSDVVACLSGPDDCGSEASGGTTPKPGQESSKQRCCPDGFSMQQLSGQVNGMKVKSCTCSKSLLKGFMVSSIQNGSVSQAHFTNYQGQPDVNAAMNTLTADLLKKLETMLNQIAVF